MWSGLTQPRLVSSLASLVSEMSLKIDLFKAIATPLLQEVGKRTGKVISDKIYGDEKEKKKKKDIEEKKKEDATDKG